MTEKEVHDLAEKYQKKADEAWETYQETGSGRYLGVYHKNQELADAFRMVERVRESHERLKSLDYHMAYFARRARDVVDGDGAEKAKLALSLAKEIYDLGLCMGLIRKE